MTDLVKYNKNDPAVLIKQKKEKAAEYLELIHIILDMMKVDMHQPALEDKLLKATAQRWMEHFERHKIPASVLVNLYNDAVDFRAKEGRWSAFSVEDMLAAWFRYQEVLATAQQNKPVNANKDCPRCKGSLRVRMQTRNGREIEVVCPNH